MISEKYRVKCSVAVHCGGSIIRCNAIQSYLFSLGFRWSGGVTVLNNFAVNSYIVIDTLDKTLTFAWESPNLYASTICDKTVDIESVFNVVHDLLSNPPKDVEYGHLPLVSFSYINSRTGKLKNRLVRLTEVDDVYYQGYEVTDKNNFKKFFKDETTNFQLVKFDSSLSKPKS